LPKEISSNKNVEAIKKNVEADENWKVHAKKVKPMLWHIMRLIKRKTLLRRKKKKQVQYFKKRILQPNLKGFNPLYCQYKYFFINDNVLKLNSTK